MTCQTAALRLAFLATLSGFSCSAADMPLIRNVSPSAGVLDGPELTITVTGKNFTENSQVKYGSTALVTTFVSSTTLTAVVPASLQSVSAVPVRLTVAGSNGTSNIVYFTLEGPTVTDISPRYAPAGSSDVTVTLTGRAFTPTTSTMGNPTYLGPTALSATIPASMLKKPGVLTFTLYLNSYLVGSHIRFYVTDGIPAGPAPVVSSITPAVVYGAFSDFTLTVDGSGFTPDSKIMVADEERWTTYVSPTRLTALIPSGGPASGPVRVVNSDGLASNFVLLSSSLPVITGLIPDHVVAGAPSTEVRIQGNGFSRQIEAKYAVSGRSSVYNLTPTYNGPSELSVVIPAASLTTAGAVQIRLSTNSLAVGDSAAELRIDPPAETIAVTSLVPNRLRVGAGTTNVVLNGQGFSSATTVTYTTSGGSTGPLTVASAEASHLTASIPASLMADADALTITASNPGGGSASTTLYVDPVLNSVTPASLLLPLPGRMDFTFQGAGFGSTKSQIGFIGSLPFVTTSVAPTSVGGQMDQLTTAGLYTIQVRRTVGSAALYSQTATITLIPVINSVSPAVVAAGSPQFNLTVNAAGVNAQPIIRWNGQILAKGDSYSGYSALVPASLVATPGTAQITVELKGAISAPFPIEITGTSAVSSLSPSSKAAGGEAFSMTVNGSGFTARSVVRWNGQDLATTFVSASALTTIVPAALYASAGTYPITVRTGSVDSNSIPFTVTAPAAIITSISPQSIEGGQAFTLTVNGTGFATGAQIRLNNHSYPTTIVSSTQLTASIPAEDTAGIHYDVGVVVYYPPSTFSNSATLKIASRPLPNSLTPSSIQAGSAAFILHVGCEWCPLDSVVQWNGQNLVTYSGGTQGIAVQVPANLVAQPGTAEIRVVGSGLASDTLTFQIVNDLKITFLNPPEMPTYANGHSLAVTGTGFVPGSVVQWNGQALVSQSNSQTSVGATVPAALIAQPGTAVVAVVNPDGTVSNLIAYTVRAARKPVIQSVSPSFAVVGAGNQILTVDGTDFGADAEALWDGIPLVGLRLFNRLEPGLNADYLKQPKTGELRVRSEGLLSDPFLFEVIAPPQITSFAPQTARAGGTGFTLTVKGTSFVSTSAVQWNGQGLPATFVSSTQLAAAVPASLISQPGTASITVISGGVTSAAVNYAIQGDLIVSRLSPAAVLAGGPSFTLTAEGSGFAPGTILRWQNTDLSTAFVDSGRLAATVPAALIADTGRVPVFAVNGTAYSASVPVEVSKIPRLDSIESSVVVGAASSWVRVKGTSFVSGVVIRWNGHAVTTYADSLLDSNAQLRAAIPPALIPAPGTASVTVENPGGFVSNALSVTISAAGAPAITGITPDSAVAGSAAVTVALQGSGFSDGSRVEFGGQILTPVVVASNTISVTVPAALLATPGSVDVSVVNADGQESNRVAFVVSNGWAKLEFTPSALEFAATAGGAAPPPQDVQLKTSDDSPMRVAWSSNCSWARISSGPTVVPAATSVSVDPARLTPGQYSCRILASSTAPATAAELLVVLTVANSTELAVSPASLEFSVARGVEAPQAQTLALSGPGASFSAAVQGDDWLSATPLAGTLPGEVWIHVVAGGRGPGTYSGSVRVQSGTADITVPVTMTITDQPLFTVAPAKLEFHLPDAAPQVLSLLVTGDAAVTFSSEAEGPLKLTDGPGARNITVSVDPEGLEPGAVVNGSVTVHASGTTPDQVTVPVEIHIAGDSEGDPDVHTAPDELSISLAQGGGPVSAAIAVRNDGGRAVEFQAKASNPWLSVPPESFSVGSPVTIVATADPEQIEAPGSYDAEIELTSADSPEPLRIPVKVTLSESPLLVVSRTALHFTAIQGGSAPAPQEVNISARGSKEATWMAQVNMDPLSDWLSFGPSSGETPSVATVLVDAAHLEAGEYTGSVIVFAPKTANVRQILNVTLTVLPPDAHLEPVIEPAALFFTPETDTRTVMVRSTGTLSYTSVAVPDDGGEWCGIEPATGSVDPDGELGIHVNFTDLAEGTHRCAIRILFGDGTLRTLSVVAQVPGETCGQPVALLRAPGEGFTATAGMPVNLELELRDGCGAPLDAARVVLNFSNGEAPVALTAVGNGLYQGTWIPANVADQMKIGAVAQIDGAEVTAQPINGTVVKPASPEESSSNAPE